MELAFVLYLIYFVSLCWYCIDKSEEVPMEGHRDS